MDKAREFTRQKKKPQALMCLKKKKMFEQQLERLDALVSRVMEQKNMLEEQQTTLGVVSDMAQAARAQKKTMAVRRALFSCGCVFEYATLFGVWVWVWVWVFLFLDRLV